jgi:hypothetical protein
MVVCILKKVITTLKNKIMKRYYVEIVLKRRQWAVMDRVKNTCVYFTSGFRGRANADAVAENMNKANN